MSKILVAGAGHGGLVAASKLAAAGHNVTVFEKKLREDCGLDQTDFFDESAMAYAGLDFPDFYKAENNQITFVPLDDDAPSLTMPKSENRSSLRVNRKEFLNRLIDLCIDAGVKFEFGTAIVSVIMLGSRAAGLLTEKGEVYADMIIDACGVDSPVRKNMPAFTLVENGYKKYDVLYTYRACFENIRSAPQPETNYNVLLKDDGTKGMTWAVTCDDEVDVLIARFSAPDENEISNSLEMIRSIYPHIGDRMISGGSVTPIPVRHPLAVLVADGYAAVGDSAFMTYAVKGSGIGYSVMAGKMLADAVIADKEGMFNCETLWEYEKVFFRDIGFDACRIAIMKNCLPYITAKEVSDMFKSGLLTSEELEYFANIDFNSFMKTKIIQLVKQKVRVLNDSPEFRSKMLGLVIWLGRFAVTEPAFPKKYERDDIVKWVQKYNEYFDSIRRNDQ